MSGEFVHDGNPVLTWCFSNAMAISDPAGNRKLDKSKARFRIDGAVAVTMAKGTEGAGYGERAGEVRLRRRKRGGIDILNTLPNKALLRPDEVADYFSVDVRTVYLWIEEGIIQNAIRVTKKTIRIPREEAIRIQKPAAV